MNDICVSGIQPTGSVHLGNYLGSLAHWANLQETMPCMFGVMDLHAITVPQDAATLRKSIFETTCMLLALGVNPKHHAIFQQSAVPQHAELAWILNCITPMGHLDRMTQYKDKRDKNNNVGLYSYPVLMAADILLYNASHVPVGEDQTQHLELTRYLAKAFNRAANQDVFREPQAIMQTNTKRVMSLHDPLKKMSKSDPAPAGCIYLNDSLDVIMQKMRKATTDSLSYVSYDPEHRKAVSNLVVILSEMLGISIEDAVARCQGMGMKAFKDFVGESINDHVTPIRERYAHYINHSELVGSIMYAGNATAQEHAVQTIAHVKRCVGLL